MYSKGVFYDTQNPNVTFSRFLEAEGLEKTYHFKQPDIVKAVDISSANKVRLSTILGKNLCVKTKCIIYCVCYIILLLLKVSSC